MSREELLAELTAERFGSPLVREYRNDRAAGTARLLALEVALGEIEQEAKVVELSPAQKAVAQYEAAQRAVS